LGLISVVTGISVYDFRFWLIETVFDW
jgi:hypothetical protein